MTCPVCVIRLIERDGEICDVCRHGPHVTKIVETPEPLTYYASCTCGWCSQERSGIGAHAGARIAARTHRVNAQVQSL